MNTKYGVGLSIWLFIAPFEGFSRDCDSLVTADLGQEAVVRTSKRYKSLPKDAVFLLVHPPGTIHFIQRTNVLGYIRLDENGVTFSPTKESPPGYFSQEKFEYLYWYNFLIKDLFIPYSDIESVNGYWGKIKVKDGRKYKFYSRSFRKIAVEINAHLANKGNDKQ